MKSILFLLPFLTFSTLQAQYYFNDIIGTQETNRQMKTYQANKVRTVSATGYDKQGAKSNDFSEFHEVKENGIALKSSSFAGLNKTVIYSRFDNQARVTSTVDSSTAVQSRTNYQYDAEGRIVRIINTVTDPENNFNQTETHEWLYNAAGKPEKMWRIISNGNAGGDSLEIRFVKDEYGNLIEERTFRRGVETGYLYYYYDDQGRITDIVRYNTKLKKLLPDVMFEYDANDRVIQKITPTSSISLGYLIWRYVFDAKGLKTKEALFNDDKQMTGKIEYSYVFN